MGRGREDRSREIELKLAYDPADADALAAAMGRLGGPARSSQLISTYYDDPDQSLRCAGFTLRVRNADGRHVQTVKAQGGGLFDRGEWEVPVAGPAPDMTAARRTPAKDALSKAGPLRPLFTSRIDRRIHDLDIEGARVEAALDVGEIEADGGLLAPVRQLELELKTGSPDALFALARRLDAQTPLRLTFETKSGLGYALLAPPVLAMKAPPVALAKGASAAEAFQAVARSALRQTVVNAAIVRARRGGEALHQLRVGLRRLRSALTLFKPVVADARFEALKAELKWLSSQMDAARDTDVFVAETFRPGAATLGGGDDLAALGRWLKRARTRAYDRATQAIDSDRGRALMIDLAEWIEAGPWLTQRSTRKARERGARAFAAQTLRKRRKAVKRLGEDLERLGPEARHVLRIAAKKLRYGVEFFAPLLPARRTRAFALALKTFQDTLGALNDIAVSRRKAAGMVAGAKAELGVAAGLVVGLRSGDEPALLKAAASQFHALVAAKRPW